MTIFALFSISLAFTIAFLFIAFLLLGQGFYMLALIFPALAADVLTRKSSLGYNSRSFLYKSLLSLFVLLEVLLIAGLFFGLFCLFFGYPTIENPVAEVDKIYTLAERIRFEYINKILLLMEVYFVLMFSYYSIKHREQFSTMKGFYYFSYRILPIISYPFAFIYLIGTLQYLLNYSNEKTLNFLPVISGYIYAVYVVYVLGKTIFMYARTLRFGASTLTLKHWINLSVSLLYNILFLYFFWHIHASI